MITRFYDELAPFFHLVFPDWSASIARQAKELDSVIRESWGEGVREVLDATCGIGTQALGLAGLGYTVSASDLAAEALERARREAASRGLNIDFRIADLRELHERHGREFDVVISCDNSVPHLLSDAEILTAFRQMRRCTRPGGGVIVSVRDYAAMEPVETRVVPYGVRHEGGIRYLIFQVWEYQGAIYDLHMYFVEDRGGPEVTTRVMRSRYYAVSIDRLLELLEEAGFARVRRLDGRFFQPLLIGDRK
jgi:SAM-dependent methyltransferase